MVSESKRVQSILEIFANKGIKNVVLSPGSRNAPLVLSFVNDERFNCISIVDERSAGFFALGMAIETNKPVAICCTSGSAALNYSSALSEAYYQKVPLIAITTDRPPEWINHGEGQSINQIGVFKNFIHSEYNLPVSESINDLHYTQRLVNEAIIYASYHNQPTQINIPFREPLYGTEEKISIEASTFDITRLNKSLSEEYALELADLINTKKKILILCGQLKRNEKLNFVLEQFAQLNNVVILTESTANLYSNNFLPCIDRVITTIGDKSDFEPELLITIGDAIISKRIKQFLRLIKNLEHWRIADDVKIEDTFLHLKKHIPIEPTLFFKTIFPLIDSQIDSNFKNLWLSQHLITRSNHDEYMLNVKWSDLRAFDIIYNTLPENCNLHLGNSSPVRYMQLFNQIKSITYYSNRGVSGIDGSTSTAAGIAYSNQNKLNILISGDLSFVYDINSLWNNNLSENLRVIVINNGGGGIFRIIPGPNKTNAIDEFFEVGNNASIEKLALAHQLNYYKSESALELESILSNFYNQQDDKRPAILEIITPNVENPGVLKDYFNNL